MVHSGLAVGEGAFEVVDGACVVGARRFLDRDRLDALAGFTARYERLAGSGQDQGELLSLGRELYRWLDGDEAGITRLRDRAPRPLVFEVCGPQRPSAEEWALLGAPFELLADADGFWAEDPFLRFSVVRRLGPAAPPEALDTYRLGVAFMASAPRGQVELDFDAEEAAILAATGAGQLDLHVEDSGDPEELGHRLAELAAMSAVHLSCHGLNRWSPPDSTRPGQPVLLMEDAGGNDRHTTAAELVPRLPAARPRLLFLSACLSATAATRGAGGPETAGTGPLVHSYATALIEAGMPAVLGWDGSVGDEAATAFAGVLYGALADRHDLAVAVGDARRGLLTAGTDGRKRDWHLARLWLGPQGGGPIVGGATKRSMVPATHGHTSFLAKERQQVPVASHAMFVGRRRQLQEALKALRSGDSAVVLLHGSGRLGKSSLAARIANRRRDLALAVVFEHYGALSVVDSLATALQSHPPARDLLEQGRKKVGDDPNRLEELLTDLLSGPCRQAGDGCPLLLVVDDLERILVAGPDTHHRVATDHVPVMTALLRAFNPALTDSRLLLTSRFPFGLGGLEEHVHAIPLPSFSDVDQRKLERRQIEAAAALSAGVGTDGRLALLERVRTVSRGNPGLQDLAGLRLVLSPAVPPDRAEDVLNQMEAWLRGGGLPEEERAREFLENLAIDALHDVAGPANRDLVRALSVLDVPVPVAVADAMAAEVGGAVIALRALGLVDVVEDLVDHRVHAVAPNAVAAARLSGPTPAEQTAVATVALPTLFAAWGGVAGLARRPRRPNLALSRLGVLADDPTVVATCAADAVLQLSAEDPTGAAALGGEAIDLLDRHEQPPSQSLLIATAKAFLTAGDGPRGDELLDRGLQASGASRSTGDGINPSEAGTLAVEFGRRLVERGKPDEAQAMFEQAVRHFEEAGDVRSEAITWGQIGDVHHARGDLDEALRIRREQELPVYQRLGDVRSEAITWGKIGDVHYQRGDLEEASRWQSRRLEVNRRLEDRDGVAATLWDLAKIDLARGDTAGALPRLEEAFTLLERVGRAEGLAIVGERYGSLLLVAAGQDQEAMVVLRRSADAYRRLGRADNAERVQAMNDANERRQ